MSGFLLYVEFLGCTSVLPRPGYSRQKTVQSCLTCPCPSTASSLVKASNLSNLANQISCSSIRPGMISNGANAGRCVSHVVTMQTNFELITWLQLVGCVISISRVGLWNCSPRS